MAEAVQSPAVTAAVREQQSVVVEAAGDRGRQAVADAARSLILQLAHVQETAAHELELEKKNECLPYTAFKTMRIPLRDYSYMSIVHKNGRQICGS